MTTLPSHSRVWIYTADRALTADEAERALAATNTFLRNWAAHGNQLFAEARLLHDRFLLIALDEQQAGASGCSIDASVHFVRDLGAELGVDFFNRMIFHYRGADGEVHSMDRAAFKQQYSDGMITPSTFVFDPLVKTLGELHDGFEKPLSDSWHARMV